MQKWIDLDELNPMVWVPSIVRRRIDFSLAVFELAPPRVVHQYILHASEVGREVRHVAHARRASPHKAGTRPREAQETSREKADGTTMNEWSMNFARATIC